MGRGAPVAPRRAGRCGVLCIAAGGAMLVAAGWLDAGFFEALVAADGARSLSWGPDLFRGLLALEGLSLLAVGIGIRAARSEMLVPETPPSSLHDPWWRTSDVWVLSALMLTALGLRIWRLESCLWLDEILTLVRFVREPLGTIVTSFPDQNQHMFYSVLARISCNVFGESAWAVRLPAVLLGVATVPAVYALGREVGTRREALLAAALLTFSYHHVWFSQNARGYAGLLLFSVLSTWLFLRGLRTGRWSDWLLYAVSGALGFWAHLTMLFVVLSHASVAVWLLAATLLSRNSATGKHRLTAATRWRPVAALAACGVMALHLHALALPEFLASALHEVSLPSEWTRPLWVVRETITGLKIGLGGLAGLAGGGALFLAGLISFARADRLFVALLMLPGILGGLTMLLLGHNLWPRFFFFTLGFLLLVAVRGAMQLGALAARLVAPATSREAWGARCGTAAAVVMVALSAVTVPRCYRLPKQDYLGAKVFVEQHRRTDEPVVAVGLAAIPYGWYYAPDWQTAQTRAELVTAEGSARRCWLVYTFPPHLKAFCPDLWEEVQRRYQVVRIFPGSLHGGEVHVCAAPLGTSKLPEP